MENIPRVGVGVVIRKDDKILLGKRKNAHGEGTWCPPGGHLEFMETIEDCARRETAEESGLEIKNIQHPPAFTEEFHVKENKHYLNLLVTCDWAAGEPQLNEPDKCEQWEWFAWNDLPTPLFLPMDSKRPEATLPAFCITSMDGRLCYF